MVIGATDIAAVADQIQKYWAPMSASQLVQTNPMVNIVNRNYQGNLQNKGDTVYVSVLNPMVGQTQTVGVDADTFSPSKAVLTRTSIVANKVMSSSIELESIVELQSLLDNNDPKLRETMMQAVSDQINAYLYSFVRASTTDGTNGDYNVATISKTEFRGARVFGGQKKWPKDGNWFALLDPSYWGDITVDSILSSSLFVGETPISGQSEFRNLLDFKTAEDNCLSTAQGLFFHREWLYFVMQQMPQWKVSDLHSNYKRGILLSVDVVCGAALNAYAGAVMHYPVYTTNSATGWVYPT
jgi:hypothetical protein